MSRFLFPKVFNKTVTSPNDLNSNDLEQWIQSIIMDQNKDYFFGSAKIDDEKNDKVRLCQ